MAAWPITTDDVQGHLGVAPASTKDGAHLALITEAVVEYVEEHTVEPRGTRVVLGAVMLAARLYARRNSPLGVQAFGDLGTAYVRSHDPDVSRMLGLGAPKVG